MGLPNSQLQILSAIEKELQADPSLAAAFSAFTSVTRSASMPPAEQLETSNSLTGWQSFRRKWLPTFLGRLTMAIVVIVAAVVIVPAAALVALPGGGQKQCEPADAAVRAGYAATCMPLGSGGHLRLPHFRPTSATHEPGRHHGSAG